MKWEKWFGNFQVNTSRYRFRWGKLQDKYKGIPCWAFSVGKAMKSLVSYAKWKRVDQPQSQNHIKLLLNPNGSYLPMGLIVFIFPLEALVVPKPKCIDKIHFRQLPTIRRNWEKCDVEGERISKSVLLSKYIRKSHAALTLRFVWFEMSNCD